jgi:hypothetical protein
VVKEMLMMFVVMMVMVLDDGHGDRVDGDNYIHSDGDISDYYGDGVEMVMVIVYIMLVMMSWSWE